MSQNQESRSTFLFPTQEHIVFEVRTEPQAMLKAGKPPAKQLMVALGTKTVEDMMQPEEGETHSLWQFLTEFLTESPDGPNVQVSRNFRIYSNQLFSSAPLLTNDEEAFAQMVRATRALWREVSCVVH